MEIPESYVKRLEKVDTLLLDLDQTLVQIRWRGLKVKLMGLMIKRFFGLIPPHRMHQAFSHAIKNVRENRSNQTNGQVFASALAASAGCETARIDRRIKAFVTRDFPKLKAHFSPMPEARNTLILAQRMGLRLAVATNPTLPVQTVLKRVAWAGLADLDFACITHADAMSRCKPEAAFFHQLLKKIESRPEACLMVGDNPEMALAASEVGILTYMLADAKQKGHPLLFQKHPELQGWGNYLTLQGLLKASRQKTL